MNRLLSHTHANPLRYSVCMGGGFIRSAEQAEWNAAKKMQWLGYWDAHSQPKGIDAGVDVVSAGALAQVKWRSAVAGRPELQRLYGAREDRRHLALLFFATSGYSEHAKQYADRVGIHLFVSQKRLIGLREKNYGPRADSSLAVLIWMSGIGLTLLRQLGS
jgi:hypothetical protein